MQIKLRKRIVSLMLAGLLSAGTMFSTAVPAENGEEEITEAFTDEALQEDEAQAEQKYALKQVVILSRHNIRSPLSVKGSVVSDITPHEWFAWTSRPGELSLRGALLETTIGQYFRLWLEKEGLFPENYIPKDGAVRFYANGLQRTQATARYFSAGLFPVADVPVECHVDYNQPDNLFLPAINFMNDEYEKDVRAEIVQRGGPNGFSGYREAMDDAMRLMMEVTDMEESEAYASGKYGSFMEDQSYISFESVEPTISGPLKTAAAIADALVLQYYEEPDDLKASFGHELTEEDWKTIGNVLGTYMKLLFTAPLLAPNLAHPILKEIYAELNAQGREFTFLCAHDSTIGSLLATLKAEEYTLPGAIEPLTPIGVKLVFERWVDQTGKSFFKVNLVYQSAEQMRSLQPLSLENPPMIVPVSFEGIETNEQGMIAEKDLMELFRAKIDLFDEIKEEYTKEEIENAA